MNEPSERQVPPVFTSEQEQNKAECAAIWFTYATESEESNDYLGARIGFVSAWKEQPDEFRYFQAVVEFLNRMGQIEELIQVYELGIQLYKDHIPTWVNFSDLLATYGFYDRAKTIAELVLAKDSKCLPAWGNLGNALRGLGAYGDAQSCYEKVLSVELDNILATFNLACILLSVGEMKRGFALYESRLRLPGYSRLASRNHSSFWNGEALKGKRVLVYAEQGLGDTFMFVRFLPKLQELGAKVIFEVQSSVLPLMSRLEDEGIDLIGRKSLDDVCSVESDYQIPLLSLAHHSCQFAWTRVKNCFYLEPPRSDSIRAKELIASLEGYKVGLCWQGNPRAAIDCGRSLSLDTYDPLFDLESVDYVSLQGRDGLELVEQCFELKDNFYRLENLDQDTFAFGETIELIRGLDLVITTDTGIAHLAGAMGKETWVILQKFPEWRWGLTKSETDWYANTRLFRQSEVGNWDTVVAELKAQLKEDI